MSIISIYEHHLLFRPESLSALWGLNQAVAPSSCNTLMLMVWWQERCDRTLTPKNSVPLIPRNVSSG